MKRNQDIYFFLLKKVFYLIRLEGRVSHAYLELKTPLSLVMFYFIFKLGINCLLAKDQSGFLSGKFVKKQIKHSLN